MEFGYQNVQSLVANVAPLPGPNHIYLARGQDYSVQIQVKSLKKQHKSFTEEQLALPVPPSATVHEIKSLVPSGQQ
jgi:hypothetical protein